MKTLTPCKRCDKGYPLKDMIQFQNEMYCVDCAIESRDFLSARIYDKKASYLQTYQYDDGYQQALLDLVAHFSEYNVPLTMTAKEVQDIILEFMENG